MPGQIGQIFTMTFAEPQGASRRRVAVAPRVALGWIAVRVYGLATNTVAQASRVPQVSILRLHDRGREDAEKRGVDAERLIENCK